MKQKVKNLIKIGLGLNLITLSKLWRLDFSSFCAGALESFAAGKTASKEVLIDIPTINLDWLIPAPEQKIKVSVGPYQDGQLSFFEKIAVASLVVNEQPNEVLEIGTFMGSTTALIAENAENAKIHTLDLPEKFSENLKQEKVLQKDDFHLIKSRVVGRQFKGQPIAERIYQHFGDSATWDFSKAGKPSFFLIDGSHTYHYCKNDTEKCFKIASKGSTFLWHDCDYGHPGVTKYLSECRSRGLDIKKIKGTNLAYLKQ